MSRLIDADEMLKRIESWNTSDAMDKALYNFTLHRIVEQPTVDAEPVRHGKWLFIRMDENKNGLYECSLCHKGETHVPQIKVNYCWNCGAKMESEEE